MRVSTVSSAGLVIEARAAVDEFPGIVSDAV
jgi:hypothetical protein